jgi:ankyrin repeat protein
MTSAKPRTGELLKAVRGRDLELARALLEQGADPNGRDPETHGRLLHSAIEFERSGEMAKLLIEFGANVNAVNPLFVTTPLMYAARSNIPVLRLLLEKEVDLDKKDAIGRTALEWAKNSGQTEAVKMIKNAYKQREQQANQSKLSALRDTTAERQKTLNNARRKVILKP